MRAACFLAVLAAFQVQSAFPQNARPACDGDIAIVRVSAIKPGAMSGFMAAVAAHKAWYRDNGFTNNVIVTSRIILRDEKTGAMRYSDAEVISYHIRPPGTEQTAAKKNAAWDAYVKQYRDTSDIKSEYMTCMPKLAP
jgi:hypothetical protein